MNSGDTSNKGVVFIVDDDEAMRNSLRWLIESVGRTVETYESARAFLENHYPGRSGCLLLDVRMPGMSGLELQSQLESHDIRLPVIILTGHGDVGMAVKAMKAGALDFIEKPFDDELLLAAIEKALTEDAEKREERASRAEILARMSLSSPSARARSWRWSRMANPTRRLQPSSTSAQRLSRHTVRMSWKRCRPDLSPNSCAWR